MKKLILMEMRKVEMRLIDFLVIYLLVVEKEILFFLDEYMMDRVFCDVMIYLVKVGGKRICFLLFLMVVVFFDEFIDVFVY